MNEIVTVNSTEKGWRKRMRVVRSQLSFRMVYMGANKVKAIKRSKNQAENSLFDTGAYVLEKNKDEIKYLIDCDTPNGIMDCYHLFPGIDLSYTTFYANSCFQRQESFPHVIEIAFCKAGRYECEYKRDFMTYLGENDLAISVINSQKDKPVFPTGFYDGVAIIIDTDIVGEYFAPPVEDVAIDFAGLVRKFCSDRCCVVMKTPQELSHVFGELCDPIHKNSLGYLRLKVLEIFLVMSDISAQDDIVTSAYFSGDTIKKVKALKNALMERLDTKISLRELAEEYDLSLTMLKDCFKAIYGKPVHAFRREYKMQVATYDVDGANQLLDEAGWVMNESTGIREKDGTQLQVIFTLPTDDSTVGSIATLIQSQLAGVGFNVEIKSMEKMEWYAGYLEESGWDITAMTAGFFNYGMPHCWFSAMMAQMPEDVSIPLLDNSEEFIAALSEFKTCNDDTRLRELFELLINTDLDQVLDIPLTHQMDMIVYNTAKIADYNFASDYAFLDVTQITPAE